MNEFIEDDDLVRFPDVARGLQILGICRELKKLPHEVKKEDIWTLDFLSTALKAIEKKRKMEMEKQKWLAENKRRG